MAEKIRRPRHVVAPTVDKLIEWATAEVGLLWEIGGSWRRGSDEVGDIDVVIFRHDLRAVELPEDFVAERRGDVIAQGEMDGIHVDFWACPPEAAGPFLWFITGPKELNIWMRSRAQKMGFKLTQTALENYAGPTVTEADVARALEMPYVQPGDRNEWGQLVRQRNRRAARSGVAILGDSGAVYRLTKTADGVACTCPGYTYRGECKHSTNPGEWTRERF